MLKTSQIYNTGRIKKKKKERTKNNFLMFSKQVLIAWDIISDQNIMCNSTQTERKMMCSETLLNDSESGSNNENTDDEDTCKKLKLSS